MHRVLIVEDEPYIRNSLVRLIPWAELGCETAGACESAEDAVSFVETSPVDLVLSDIRMDGMSGLDLASFLASAHPEIKVIILTGYADFEYARSAVRLNVVDFILKPTDPLELESAVRKAVAALDQTRRRDSAIAELRLQLARELPKLRSQFLSDLLHGTVLPAEAEGRAVFLGVPEGPLYLLALGLDGYPRLLEERGEEALQLLRLGLLKLALEDRGCPVWGCAADPRTLAVAYHGEDPEEYAEELAERAAAWFSVSLSVGISLRCSRPALISGAYGQAKEALSYRFYAGEGSVAVYEEESAGCRACPSRIDTTELEEALDTGDEARAAAALQSASSFLPSEGSEGIAFARNVALELLLSAQRTALRYGLPAPAEILTQAMDLETLQELRRAAEVRVAEVCRAVAELNRAKRRSAVAGIMKFLEENYSRPLGLEDLSAGVYRSPKYLCRLLKQETGRSFSDILLSIRMREAESLLRSSGLSVAEVGERVGIRDPHYFSKVFRKHSGRSPTEFRASL